MKVMKMTAANTPQNALQFTAALLSEWIWPFVLNWPILSSIFDLVLTTSVMVLVKVVVNVSHHHNTHLCVNALKLSLMVTCATIPLFPLL